MDKYKLVPVEPTEEMLEAGHYAMVDGYHPGGVYRTMLDAAPAVQGKPVAYLRKDQLRQAQRMGPTLGEIAASPRVDRVPVYAAPITEQVERWRHDSEDLEALHNNLDDAGTPRHDSSGIEYSEWGRVIQYAKAAAPQPAGQQPAPTMQEETLADRMRAAGMMTIDEMMAGTPLDGFIRNTGVHDLDSYGQWLDAKCRHFLTMQAKRELNKDPVDDMYEWVIAHAAAFKEARINFNAARPVKPELQPEMAKYQPCGCVVCTCEHETQCMGCGARHCGTHPVGQIPNPAYQQVDRQALTKIHASRNAADLHARNRLLADALEQILGWRELRSGREFPIERIEDIALAAHRKQGGDV